MSLLKSALEVAQTDAESFQLQVQSWKAKADFHYASALQLAKERDSLKHEVERLRRDNQPWPLIDIVRKLCEATDILLYQKDYDQDGHEQISHALIAGREWLTALAKEKV